MSASGKGVSQIFFFFLFLWVYFTNHLDSNLFCIFRLHISNFWGFFFSFLLYFCWLSIIYEGSIPEMCIWPISFMQYDFKIVMVH